MDIVITALVTAVLAVGRGLSVPSMWLVED